MLAIVLPGAPALLAQSPGNAPETKPRTQPAPAKDPAPRRTAPRSVDELPDGGIHPDRAPMYGIFPGGGQYYLGQEGAALLQLGVFLSAEYLRQTTERRSDYIPRDERRVEFNIEEFVIARELERKGLLYQDRQIPPGAGGNLLLIESLRRGLSHPLLPNVIGETRTDRAARMLDSGNLIELNPLVSFEGGYSRINRVSIEADFYRDLTRWTIMYSVFSADRDALAYLDGIDPSEDFVSLSSAPFQTEVLSDPLVWAPVVVTPLLLDLQRQQGRRRGPLGGLPDRLMAPPGTFTNPTTRATLATSTLGSAVAEEALFRGVAHRRLSRAYGLAVGSVLSSSLYTAYQYGMGNENLLPQFAYSMYWSFLETRSDSDLRPAVASHFWTNVAMLLYSLNNAREDARAGRSSQEIHFMPVFFTFET